MLEGKHIVNIKLMTRTGGTDGEYGKAKTGLNFEGDYSIMLAQDTVAEENYVLGGARWI